ncbi:MAG: undecaprenyl/decaprenyl-phosphate alpha-N-acetylglucosaminyl 1-phosphate transferase [Anaerolineales bacterium]|nr:undecaprenyl/decaprenyl-phosphate alpha-N-acetylglucosaminyl 1-phosphate transferase [Anaerolineales bacterium]
MVRLSLLFPVILLAGTVAFLCSFPVQKLALRKGFLDCPDSAPHKLHQSATPLGGGIVLLVSIWAGWMIFGTWHGSVIPGLLGATSLIMLWGLVDDRYGLEPLPKLAGQIIATVFLILAGIQAHIFSFNWANYLITLFWMVGLSNAFNFVDSMDGLALGIAIIASGFFMLVTIDSGQPELARLSAVLLGAGIGLMFLNTQPARLFLGDSGAQLLGFLLAAIGIAYNPAGLPQEVSWFTPILVLGVPVFDMVLVVFSRLRRKMPVYQAGHDHSYHRLVRMGLDSNRAVVGMHLIAGGLGLTAFILLGASVLWANVIYFAILMASIILILWLEFHNPVKAGQPDNNLRGVVDKEKVE